MARAVVLLAEGFEEIEAVTIIDVLRRAKVEVATAALVGDVVTGSHGIAMRADVALDRAASANWELVVLPGGMPGASTLRDDPRVISLLRAQNERGGLVAAICAAPIALARAGLLQGRTATSYPNFRGELGEEVRYSTETVVRDGNVITSRGPATALPFALALVEALNGAAGRDSVAAAMLVPDVRS